MAYTNALNTIWNEAHNGMRVPINNTGIPGAPAALNASLPEWTDGSINKAVYNAWIQYYTFNDVDVADAEGGTMDLLRCTRHVIPEMLYGFNGDSRYKTPGDAMSFRGYPTGIVLAHSTNVETPYSEDYWDASGTLVSSAGRYSILSSQVLLQFKIPYDFQYTVLIKQGTSILFTYEVQIEAGNFVPTHYRGVGDTNWIPLSSGKVYFSMDMLGFSGDQVFTIQAGNVVQEPFYGTLDDIVTTLEEQYYNPASVPIIQHIGIYYRTASLVNISCYINSCSEISGEKLFLDNGGIHSQLYTPFGNVGLGYDVFIDEFGTVPAPVGQYLGVDYKYLYYPSGSFTGVAVYRINRDITVGTLGKITSFYNNVTAGSDGCHETSFCF